MSDASWTLVGIAVAVVLVGVGLWLLLSSRAEARHASRRPSRDSFRTDPEDTTPMRRLAVILNPTKLEDEGSAEKATIASVCADQGWAEPLFLATEEHDVGFGQTRRALEEGVDLVCAYGGDGTVRAVAQEMVGSGVPMGLLPGGTGNLLARNLELPTDDLARAVEVAITGRNRHIDVGWMTLDPSDMHLEEHVGEGSSAGAERHAFLVMAGLGLDAAIMDDTSEELKARVGWTAYVPAGMKNLLIERFKARLTLDDAAPQDLRARTILIGNCGKLTGGIDLMPDAEPDDGTLDVVVLSPRGVAAWASVIARVVTKSDRSTKGIDRFRCQKAEVRIDHLQRVEIDGDIIGEAMHLVIEVQERSLVVRTENGRPQESDAA